MYGKSNYKKTSVADREAKTLSVKKQYEEIEAEIENLFDSVNTRETQKFVKNLLDVSENYKRYSLTNKINLSRQETHKQLSIISEKESKGEDYKGLESFQLEDVRTYRGWQRFFETHLTPEQKESMTNKSGNINVFKEGENKSFLEIFKPARMGFIYEKDENGKPKKDENDKLINKLDKDGKPIRFVMEFSLTPMFDVNQTVAKELGIYGKEKEVKYLAEDINMSNELYENIKMHISQNTIFDISRFSIDENLTNSQKISLIFEKIGYEHVSLEKEFESEKFKNTFSACFSYSLSKMYGIENKTELELAVLGSDKKEFAQNLKFISREINGFSDKLFLNKDLTEKEYEIKKEVEKEIEEEIGIGFEF